MSKGGGSVLRHSPLGKTSLLQLPLTYHNSGHCFVNWRNYLEFSFTQLPVYELKTDPLLPFPT